MTLVCLVTDLCLFFICELYKIKLKIVCFFNFSKNCQFFKTVEYSKLYIFYIDRGFTGCGLSIFVPRLIHIHPQKCNLEAKNMYLIVLWPQKLSIGVKKLKNGEN